MVGVVTIGGGSPPAEGSNNKAARVLPNLQFVEGDMSEVAIEPGAFVVSVHGGSESIMASNGCLPHRAANCFHRFGRTNVCGTTMCLYMLGCNEVSKVGVERAIAAK